MKTWCVLGAALLMMTACKTTEPAPDPEPETVEQGTEAVETEGEAKVDSANAPILDDAKRASIDAFWKAEINDDSFVPIYVSTRGVAVDGKDAVRFDPETRTFRDEDRKGGPDSLYIKALTAPFEDASRARVIAEGEVTARSSFLGPGIFIEDGTRYGTFTDILYTAGQDLRPTYADGTEGDRFVVIGGSQPVKVITRKGDEWYGFNASSPKLSVGPEDDAPEEEPLDLTIFIGANGIRVAAQSSLMMPIDGCPVDGPTICNEEGTDGAKLLERVKSTQGAEREAAIDALVAAYNLSGLYNKVLEIKAAYPDETVVTIAADTDMPFAVVSAVTGAVRTKRAGGDAKGHFADDSAFDAAAPSTGSFRQGDLLFPYPVFGLALSLASSQQDVHETTRRPRHAIWNRANTNLASRCGLAAFFKRAVTQIACRGRPPRTMEVLCFETTGPRIARLLVW